MKKRILFSVTVAVGILLIVSFLFLQLQKGSNQDEDFVVQDDTTLQNQDSLTLKTYNIKIDGFAFKPQELTINVGETVIWRNEDSTPHTVTSTSGTELKSGDLSRGQIYSHTFNESGTFDYYCRFHTGMKAKIIVK